MISSMGGTVVIRKSNLSFVRPRRPMTDTALDAVTRTTPWKELGSDGKSSFANFAILPPTGILRELVRPVEVPSSRNVSRLTLAVVTSAFAIATPL